MKPFSHSRAAQNLPKRSLNCLSTPQGVRVFKLPADSSSTPQGGYKLRVVSQNAGPSERLPFLLIRFLWASRQSSAVLYADNENE